MGDIEDVAKNNLTLSHAHHLCEIVLNNLSSILRELLLTLSLTGGGGGYWPPSFSKACSSKSYEVLKNKLFHGNYLSFKFVFRCFFKKSRFFEVIHVT
jgi:hypothetical protein